MASTAALELLVSLDDKASKGLDDIADKGGGLGDAIKGGAKIAGGAILGLGAVLLGAAKAAGDDKQSMNSLMLTVKNAGASYGDAQKDVEAFIQKQQKLAFTDDETRDSLKLLVAQTHNLSEAQQLAATAADLARFGNIDLERATRLVLKADDESYAALGKLGIQIDKNATKEQALQSIRAATAGQADQFANSTAGTLARIQDTMGEAFESVGSAILPLIEGPLKQFADFMQSPEVQAGIAAFAEGVGTALTNAINFLSGAFNAVMPYIQPFIDALTSFWSTVTGGGDIMAALGQYFTDFGTAVGNVWPIVSEALGSLLGNIVQWIIDNGPTILTTLATWTGAFVDWAWNDALPKLLTALGGLIDGVWKWIVQEGPGILSQLGTWTTSFVNWAWNDALPKLLEGLGGLIAGVWKFITDNGPTILAKLAEWTTAFFNWVWTDVLPQLPGWLANIAAALWKFVTDNGPVLLTKLGEWTTALFNWVMTDIVPKLPGWLADIATALWKWLTQTAKDLGSKLLNEWLPAFWQWITGEGGVLANIGAKLGEIWDALGKWIANVATDIVKTISGWVTSFWTWITGPDGVVANIGKKLAEIWTGFVNWITTTAGKIVDEVKKIGSALADGIKQGWNATWPGVQDFLTSALSPGGSLISDMKKNAGIKSPSTMMADEIGVPLAAGIGVGFGDEWTKNTVPAMKAAMGGAWEEGWSLPEKRAQEIASLIAGPIGTAMPTAMDAIATSVDGAWEASWGLPENRAAELAAMSAGPIATAMPEAMGAIATSVDGAWDATWGLPEERAKQLAAMSGTPIADAIPEAMTPIATAIDGEWEGTWGVPENRAKEIAALAVDPIGGAMLEVWGAYSQQMADLFDATWGDMAKRAKEIADLAGGPGYIGSNGGTGTGGGAGTGTGQAYAMGGRPPVGVASLVGERGPELFVPDRSGRIIPNNRLGGMGGNVTIGDIIINAGVGADGRRIGQDFIDEISARLGIVRRATVLSQGGR